MGTGAAGVDGRDGRCLRNVNTVAIGTSIVGDTALDELVTWAVGFAEGGSLDGVAALKTAGLGLVFLLARVVELIPSGHGGLNNALLTPVAEKTVAMAMVMEIASFILEVRILFRMSECFRIECFACTMGTRTES